MSTVWVAFWVGCWIGGFAGMIVVALCVSAKHRDDCVPPQDRLCRSCRSFLEES